MVSGAPAKLQGLPCEALLSPVPAQGAPSGWHTRGAPVGYGSRAFTPAFLWLLRIEAGLKENKHFCSKNVLCSSLIKLGVALQVEWLCGTADLHPLEHLAWR